MQDFSTEVFNALTGVKQDLFNYIYLKYCGPGTPICQSDRISNLLHLVTFCNKT